MNAKDLIDEIRSDAFYDPSTERREVKGEPVTEPTIQRGIYRHFKGRYYLVEGIVAHSETAERLVLYRPLYGDYQLVVRPLAMFVEAVTNPHDAQYTMPRFQLVKETS